MNLELQRTRSRSLNQTHVWSRGETARADLEALPADIKTQRPVLELKLAAQMLGQSWNPASDTARHALVGERSGETYQLGDRVEVKLVEATPVSGGMRFEVVSEGRAGQPMPRRAVRPSRQTPRKGPRRR